MTSRNPSITLFVVVLTCIAVLPAAAQSFRVQCPATTITHPATLHDNNAEPAYTGQRRRSPLIPTDFWRRLRT